MYVLNAFLLRNLFGGSRAYITACELISEKVMEGRNYFHVADFVIFGATLIASMTIGLYFGLCKKKDFSSMDYFFGGKKLRSIPVALSFVVTFQSSLMLLGVPADVYGYGLKLSFSAIGAMTAFIVGACITVPVFRPLKITSIYKYFSLRYGSNEVRFMAATLGVIYFVFYMAVVVLGTCVALNSVLQVPFWATVITYTLVTTIYTSLGGFKAVIWTDVFQLVVMVMGILATLIKSTQEAGGSASVYSLGGERFSVADFRVDPTLRYTFWTSWIGAITQYLYLCFTQSGLQRIKSTPSAKGTYVMYAVASPIYCLFFLLCVFEGVSIFAYYASKGCDPLASGRISNINEVVPTAVMDLFGKMPGLPGLFIASLSSAVLSTLSSCLAGLSSITYEDIIKLKYPDISDRNATKWSKIVVFIYGILAMGVCFLLTLLSGPVPAIFQAFMGSVDGPACGIFIMSIFFRRSTTKGIIIGTVSGMLASMALNLGQTFVSVPSNVMLPLGPTNSCFVSERNTTVVTNMTKDEHIFISTVTQSALNLTTESGFTTDAVGTTVLQKIFGISYMLFSLIGFLVTLFVGIIASILSKPTPEDKIDTMTLYPLPDRFCSLFPDGFFYSKSEEKERQLKNEENLQLMKPDQEQTKLFPQN